MVALASVLEKKVLTHIVVWDGHLDHEVSGIQGVQFLIELLVFKRNKYVGKRGRRISNVGSDFESA